MLDRIPVIGLACGLCLWLGGCLASTYEPPLPAYHNPLDLYDAGQSDGGPPPADAGPPSGTVDGRSPDLSSAIYWVEIQDAGAPRTVISLSDVGNLCAASSSDGGLGADWNLLRFRLAGDGLGTYVVAPLLAPTGAIGEFDFQSAAGGFGVTQASSGSIELDAVDPANQSTATGRYTLSFNGTDSLTGRFAATPCAASPAAPGS